MIIKYIKIGLLAITLTGVLILITCDIMATTYYFSTLGDDGNEGLSPGSPKKSLNEAKKIMNPGDTILFKRGDSWYNPGYEWELQNKMGTMTEPIIVDTYGTGPKPIIANMDLMDSDWSDQGSNIWRHAFSGYSGVNRVFVDGLSKKNVDLDELDQSYEYAVSGSYVYIYSTLQPTLVEVIPDYGATIHLDNCSYLTFRNLDIRGGGKWVCFHAENRSSHVTVDSCIFQRFNFAGLEFSIYNGSSSYYHDHPVVKNCIISKVWSVYENDPAKSAGGDGVCFRNAVESGLIQNNKIIDIGHTGLNVEMLNNSFYGVHNNIVELNEVYNINCGYARGFETKGTVNTCTNNIVRRNYFHDMTNSSHVLGKNNKIYSNIFVNFDETKTGGNKQAYAMDLMPWDWYECKDNIIVNNTIYDCEYSSIRINLGATSRNIIKNNLIVSWGNTDEWPDFGLRIDYGAEQICENNCMWNYDDEGKVIRLGDNYYTADEANSELSNFSNNLQVDPLFIDEENRDFRLQDTSLCINAGQVINDMGPDFVDFEGNAWDSLHPSIGAYQYDGVPPPPPAAPSDLSAATISFSVIDLNWTDNSDNESNFVVEFKKNAGVYADCSMEAANTTSLSVTDLQASTTYYFRVKATNSNGDSDYSNEDFATTSDIQTSSVIPGYDEVFVKVFPSPAEQTIYVELNKMNDEQVMISLVNSTGTIIQQRKFYCADLLEFPLNNNKINPGIYIIRVSNDKTSIDKTIILE